ncbi:hypothetical protein CS542_08445 [Pedobacter sp. IW39]|nr:hypothetical protein CS542_08445 [Pedobacter sp. IW39]
MKLKISLLVVLLFQSPLPELKTGVVVSMMRMYTLGLLFNIQDLLIRLRKGGWRSVPVRLDPSRG